MALLANVIDERGYVYADQYINIHEIIVAKEKITVVAAIHKSQQSSNEKIPPHRVEYFAPIDFDINNQPNLWEVAYVVLKQKWTYAQDC